MIKNRLIPKPINWQTMKTAPKSYEILGLTKTGGMVNIKWDEYDKEWWFADDPADGSWCIYDAPDVIFWSEHNIEFEEQNLEYDWQPIITAPKVNYILVTNGKYVCEAAWKKQDKTIPYEGWYSSRSNTLIKATYWLPLPEILED